jgi:hypothetical protein
MNINVVKPERISLVLWVVADVSERVDSTGQSNRIFGDEPPKLRVVETSAVVEQTC